MHPVSTLSVTAASHMARPELDLPRGSTDSPLRLSVLGEAVLTRPDGSIAIGPSKPLALIAYLHCAPGRTATREHLAALLWGDSAPRLASGSLRTTLHRIHTLVGEHAAEGGTTAMTLQLALQVDRDVFLAAVAEGDFTRAVDLYRGPFFPDYGDPGTAEFEHWADLERARLQELFLRAAESLARRALDCGQAREATRLARRIRTLVPGAETGWRLLLEALLLARDDLAARAEAESFAAWAREDGSAPGGAMKALITRIRDGGAAVDGPEASGLIAELIGRERQFSAILHTWASVRRGQARLIHVSAAAGIGKTRLLTDVTSRLVASGARVVSLRANSGERTLDYAFAGDLVRRLGSLSGAVGVPPSTAGVLVGLQPALSSMFAGAPAAAGADLLLQRALAVGELLRAVADDAPLALVVDDTHWLDGASRSILRSLASRLEGTPVLLLTAGRPTESAMATDVPAMTLTLEPLSVADVGGFLASLGTVPEEAWADRLIAALQAATRGSPLLLVESLQLARDRDELSLSEGRWACSEPDLLVGRLASRDAMAERLAALGAEPRQLMVFLAVSGAPLRGDDLASLSNTSPASVDEAMSGLERKGLALGIGGKWAPAHDEIAEALWRSIPERDRIEAHRTLGRLLSAERGSGVDGLPRAAQHLAAAGAAREIGPLYRRWLAAARHRGDQAAPRHLAEEFLGEYATPALVKGLEATLPLRARYGIRLRHVIATAGMVLVGGLIAWRQVTSTVAPPEEELLLSGRRDSGDVASFRIPVRANGWNDAGPIRPAEGRREPAWVAGSGNQGWPAVSPDGKRIAYARVVSDSGVTDLFLRESDGTVRRLTDAVGDDLEPSWSPDGRSLAFRTARWTPRGDDDADIAVLDLATGRVRQLTAGPTTDRGPRWSPDGSRIAFIRQRVADGHSTLCWTSADGTVVQCRNDLEAEVTRVAGWLDAERLMVASGLDDGSQRLGVLSLSAGSPVMVDTTTIGTALLSADGRWLVEATSGRGTMAVFPVDDPRRRRVVGAEFAGGESEVAWMPVHRALGYRWRLGPPGRPVVDVSHQMRAGVVDALGRPLTSPAGVLRWRSGDSSRGVIDSLTGVFRASRPGPVWVHADAGGWWNDSVQVNPRIPSVSEVLTADWRDPTLKAWRLFGDPLPRVVDGPGGVPAFHNNGDNTFASGAVSVQGYTAEAGLGVEALVSTPITRPKWQRLKLSLMADIVIESNGSTGLRACGFDLPVSEGARYLDSLTVSGGEGGAIMFADPALRSGRWYRVRLQLFPDASCGVAIDGTPLFRSSPGIDLRKTYFVATSGQSVETRILVGPLSVWQGVRTDVNWARLDRPQPR